MKKNAILIDGNSLLYRFFYATINQLDYFKQHNMFPTNALKMMINVCYKLKKQKQYDYGVIAFDSSKQNFRTKIFSEYKANRNKMPNELFLQLKPVQEALKMIGFNVIFIDEIEADDIIGSCAKIFTQNNVLTDIYSSDKDLLQLVDENISVNLIKQGLTNIITYNNSNFKELNDGLDPYQIIEYKGIVGDNSDNLKGVKGIGPKTGIDLLIEYKTIHNIYNHLDDLSKSIKTKFLDNKDSCFLCKELATIKIDLFNNDDIQNFAFKNEQTSQMIDFLKNYHLEKLIDLLNLK